MSKGLFSNWRFRTSTPAFEPGQRIEAYLTAFDTTTGRAEARIGDSILDVSGASAGALDTLVDLTVESFDPRTHRGSARVVD